MVMFYLPGQAPTIGKGQAVQAGATQPMLRATAKPLTVNLYLLFIQELLEQILLGLEASLIPENTP